MSRRSGGGLAPSLFPFLAVLICTLGTLILLLALVAKNASSSAQQYAESKRVAASKDLAAIDKVSRDQAQRQIAEGQAIVDKLVSFRGAQTEDLERRREQITHIENHMRRIRDELARLGKEVELAINGSAAESPDMSQIEALQTKLESEKKSLEQLRSAARNKKPRVVIVPHKGPNGTDRRPIYLECTANGITIHPEQSRIEIEQLIASDKMANPVDAALRTVRLYALQNYGDSAPPYPLLVVRPDGIETYVAARYAMQDWDDQFGYELVPADVDLAFARPDPKLKTQVDLAIKDAVQRQVAIGSLLAIGSGRDRAHGSGSSTKMTGDASESNLNGNRTRVRTLSAAELDRQGRAGGFADARESLTSRNAVTSSSTYSTTANENASAARQLDEHLRTAAKELAQRSGEPDSRGQISGIASGANVLNSDNGNGFALPELNGTETGSLVTGTIAQVPNQNAKEPSGNSPAGIGTGFAAPSSLAINRINLNDTLGKLAGTGTQSGDDASSDERNSEKTDSSDEVKLSGDKTSFRTSSTGGSPGKSGSTSSVASGVASGPATAGSATAPAPASGSAPMSTSGTESSDQAAPSVTISNTPQTIVKKRLQRKGADWALPENVAGRHGTSVVRTIRVVCEAEQLILLPSASGGAIEIFGFSDGQIDRATFEMAAALKDRIESWGPSLPGGRWMPRLEVEFSPDGKERYEQLKMLLDGSGVDVVGRNSR